MTRILVIKLGALGDCVQACGHVRALKQHNPAAQITVLTRLSFVRFWQNNPYVSKVVASRGCDADACRAVQNADVVFDLQNTDRTGTLAFLNRLWWRKQWYGTTRFAAARVKPDYTTQRVFYADGEILENYLQSKPEPDDLDWLKSDLSRFNLTKRYALLIAGCSPKHPHKRWPVDNFVQLATHFANVGITPILVGAGDEQAILSAITTGEPRCINLCGQTKLTDLPALARGAVYAVGNDTGPIHFIGVTGCKTVVLFGSHSDPAIYRPLGKNVVALREQPIENLGVERVKAALAEFL